MEGDTLNKNLIQKERKILKNLLTEISKSAILELPKERAVTAESATSNLLGCQEKKNWCKKIKKLLRKA